MFPKHPDIGHHPDGSQRRNHGPLDELPGPKVQVIPPTPLPPVDPSDPSTADQLRRARGLLDKSDPSVKTFLKFNKDTLRILCDENNISYPGKSQKLNLVEKIFTSVSCAAYKLFGTSDRLLSLVNLSSVPTALGRRRAW